MARKKRESRMDADSTNKTRQSSLDTKNTNNITDEVEHNKLVSRYCRYSLAEKWNKDSIDHITDPCPFCIMAIETEPRLKRMCEKCLCPQDICNDSGRGGYILVLNDKYRQPYECGRVCDIKKDLKIMEDLFKKYIIVNDDHEQYEYTYFGEVKKCIVQNVAKS